MRVLIVGPSFRYASGLSYYTIRLANALEGHSVSAIRFRELLPKALFPGSSRVGEVISQLKFSSRISVFDGIDWYWLPSLISALRFAARRKPDVLILPWWTSAVAHTEVALALLTGLFGRPKVIIEFHESLDPMEATKPVLRAYASVMRRLLFWRASAFVAHSGVERAALVDELGIDPKRTFVVPHGTYDNIPANQISENEVIPAAAPSVVTYTFTGLLRTYKGVENLVRAFDGLPPGIAEKSRLVIAGESWDDRGALSRLIQASPNAGRITLRDRYLTDQEMGQVLDQTDICVLPYLRASQSGVAHIAMARGLPLVASAVGGLEEACREYEGSVLVPPADVGALTDALLQARSLAGRVFADPFPWSRTAAAYDQVLEFVTGAAHTETSRSNLNR